MFRSFEEAIKPSAPRDFKQPIDHLSKPSAKNMIAMLLEGLNCLRSQSRICLALALPPWIFRKGHGTSKGSQQQETNIRMGKPVDSPKRVGIKSGGGKQRDAGPGLDVIVDSCAAQVFRLLPSRLRIALAQ